ncbi:MAG: hypothetical protein SVU32_05080 [Candidatus Nanohaloarchaea archaeon]|nr:hypothetical protein [Candidatus Nanohaloarchaea archaeon]
MSGLWTTVRRFLATTKRRFLVFLIIDGILLWLLFRAKLVCVERLSYPSKTSCYTLTSGATSSSPAGILLVAVVVSFILYILFQIATALYRRSGASEETV